MTLGKIAVQAATSGECELPKFAFSCIRFVDPSARSSTKDFNSREWNPGFQKPGFTQVLENFQTRKPGFVRRRKPGFDRFDFLDFSAICKSLVLAKLVTLHRNS